MGLSSVQVAALLLGSLGCIALLGVTQAPRAAHVRVQELMTASDAAQMSSSATIDAERSIYAAQMKAMRRLKGDLLRANTDLGQFFAETVASKVDNAQRIAESELAEATHKVSNTETDMENKKLRMKELTDGALLKSVNDAQAEVQKDEDKAEEMSGR